MTNHVMLDLETLGTAADAVILSIGAVKFNAKKINDAGFYSIVSVESNLALKRRVQEDTLAWWMKQSDAARALFLQPGCTLQAALEDLADWIGNDDVTVWSNGASFDIPILEHAYVQTGLTVPWKFWNTRCFRTVKSLPLAKSVPAPTPAIAHHALHDAIAQARHLQAIWAKASDENFILV